MKDYLYYRENTPNYVTPTSPFADNVFIVNHKRKHMFTAIAKGGSSMIKSVSAQDDKVKLSEEGEVRTTLHDIYGPRADGQHTVKVGSDEFEEYTRVAIFRDPVSRFISWYYDKIVYPYQVYIVCLGFATDGSFERTIQFLEFELSKKDPLFMDEHVRPQAKCYQLKDVDYIVELKDLNDYLKSIGVKIKDKSLNHSLPKDSKPIPEWVEAKIKELYAEDYKMIASAKDKLWTPEK